MTLAQEQSRIRKAEQAALVAARQAERKREAEQAASTPSAR